MTADLGSAGADDGQQAVEILSGYLVQESNAAFFCTSVDCFYPLLQISVTQYSWADEKVPLSGKRTHSLILNTHSFADEQAHSSLPTKCHATAGTLLTTAEQDL